MSMRLLLVAATSMLALSACGGLMPTYQEAKKLQQDGTDQRSAAQAASKPTPSTASDRQVTYLDRPYLGAGAYQLESGIPLPPMLEGARGFQFVQEMPLSLVELGQEISARTRIPVVVEGAEPPGSTPAAPARSLPIAYPGGPLSGFLDLVAASHGAAWRYDGRQIHLSLWETRNFTVYAMPEEDVKVKSALNSALAGTTSSTSAGSGGSGGGSSATLAQQSVEVSGTLRIWKDLEAGLRGILPDRATIAVSPSTGTITVTAPAGAMRAAARYLREQNDRLGRVIALDTKILTYTADDSDEAGLDVTALLKNALDGIAIGASSPASIVSSGAGSVSFAVVDPPAGSTAAKWDGSKVIVQALSRVGKVTTTYHRTILTMNNVPQPVQIARSQGYIKDVVVAPGTAVSQPTQGITQGTVVTGFNLVLLPRIYSAGRYMLSLGLNNSEFLGFRTLTSGNASVQAPDIASNGDVNRFAMRSGSTLVLSGYGSERSEVAKSGMGNADFFLLGGGRKGTVARTHTLIVVTGQVLRSPLTEPDIDAAPASPAVASR